MLIVTIVVFFVCWTPILLFNLLAAFGQLGEGDLWGTAAGSKHVKTVFSLMAYANRCGLSD